MGSPLTDSTTAGTSRTASTARALRRAVQGPRRLSLLVRFGVTSLLLFVALGAVLGHALKGAIEQRALDSSVREARVVTVLGIQQALAPDEIATGLSPDRRRAVGLALTAALAPVDVVDVTIWDLAGAIVYATDPVAAERLDAAALARAAAGDAAARILDVAASRDPLLRRHGTILEAYLPLRFGSETYGDPAGVVRATLPFAPVAETIAADTRRLYVVLAGGLALLYAVLFRLVAGASRTLRRHAADREHQALHDALTGLGNRAMFHEQLHRAVAVARRGGQQLTVVLMDLDRFKEINDTLGHHHGDLLLQQVAVRLRETLRAGDTVARLGGDEFALLLPQVGDGDAAVTVARKVHAALERPITVRGLTLEVGASLGIALFPEHGRDAETLLKKADVAMYTAKREQRGHALYDPAEDQHSRDRLALSGQLRRAIDAGELLLHFQPKIDLASDRVVGVEALVRWQHPQHGLLGPDRFIPLAERGDLIRPLTRAVLDLALEACASWSAAGLDLGVAVNLSVRNLHGRDLPATVSRLLERHGVRPGLLTLEITETTIAADPTRAVQALTELRALGVRLSIDDFGTGYSSLAVLRGLPVDELKIDRSFVTDLAVEPDAAAIVGFSAQLGHQLGLAVVAEGVEDQATAARLRAIGCDVAQGYWFSRPVPLDELTRWLDDDATSPAEVAAPAGGGAARR